VNGFIVDLHLHSVTSCMHVAVWSGKIESTAGYPHLS